MKRTSGFGFIWRCDDESVWICLDRDTKDVLYSIYPRHSSCFVVYEGYLTHEIDKFKSFKRALLETDRFFSMQKSGERIS